MYALEVASASNLPVLMFVTQYDQACSGNRQADIGFGGSAATAAVASASIIAK